MKETGKSSRIGQGRRSLRLLMFALVMLAGIGMPVRAKAETKTVDITYGYATYTVKIDTAKRTATLKGYKNPTLTGAGTAEILLKSTLDYNGQTYTVDALDMNCLGSGTTSEKTAARRIYVPATIVTVNGYAFEELPNLEEVSMQNCTNLTYLSNHMFTGCSKLTTVSLPASLTAIGDEAFENCTSLKYINKSSVYADLTGTKVAKIGKNAFIGCTSLNDICLPKTITTIGDYAFKGDTALQRVYYADGAKSLTSIGEYAFMETGLTNFGLPEGCQTLGRYAFKNCTALKSIFLPKTLTSMGYNAFEGCSALTTVDIPSGIGIGWINSSTFKGCTALTGITIPNGITYIGDSAFYGCNKLTGVTLPSSLTEIGSSAFSGCTSLKSITLPADMQKIYSYAFDGCSALTNIDFEQSVGLRLYSIGDYAFRGCSSLAKFNNNNNPCSLPNTLSSIGKGAFENCINLPNITIKDRVAELPDDVFKGCSKLTGITMSAGIKKIGKNCFSGTKITTIEIPYGVEEMSADSLSGCTTLATIYYTKSKEAWNALFTGASAYAGKVTVKALGVAEGNSKRARYGDIVYEFTAYDQVKAYTGIDGIKECLIQETFELGGRTVAVTGIQRNGFLGTPTLTKVDIPATVTAMGGGVFYNCAKLSTVTLQPGLIGIGVASQAFYGTPWYEKKADGPIISNGTLYAYKGTAPASASIPEGVTRIGTYAFAYQTTMKSVAIPDTVTSIETGAFDGCTALTSVSIPDGVTAIGLNAFNDCDALTAVSIPQSVKTIGKTAFGGDTMIKTIHYGGTKEEWDALIAKYPYSDIGLVEGSVTVVYQTYVTRMMDADSVEIVAYNGTETNVVVPTSLRGKPVRGIGDRAFKNNTTVASVVLPGGLTRIGDEAFYGCSKLASINIPSGVTAIGDKAFIFAGALPSISLPASVETIGKSAFYRCAALEDVTLTAGLKKIGESAFSDCTKLKTIAIPATVTEIEKNAFELTGLTGVTFASEAQLTRIGEGAFSQCASLTSVALPDSVAEMGEGVFNKCSVLSTANIPKSLANIPAATFANTSLSALELHDKVSSIGIAAFEGVVVIHYRGTQAMWEKVDNKVNIADGKLHVAVEIPVKAATCTEKGVSKAGLVCSKCEDVVYEAPVYTEKLGHDDTAYGWDTDNHWNLCKRCGAVKEGTTSTHSGTSPCVICKYTADHTCSKVGATVVEGVDATCTEDGYKGYAMCKCGKFYELTAEGELNTGAQITTDLAKWKTSESAVIPKKDHTPVTDAGKEATCTETGLTEGSHCSVCGEITVPQTIIAMKAHSYAEKKDMDYHWQACGSCGAIKDKAAHSFDADGKCSCGYTSHTHEAKESFEGVAATCTKTGLKAYYLCACGNYFSVQSDDGVLSGLIGSEEAEVNAWKVIPAKGHTEASDADVEATCTSVGYTGGSHCLVCDEVIIYPTEVAMKPHTTDDEWQKGQFSHWKECSVCHEQVDMAAHTYGEDETCSVCGAEKPDHIHSATLVPGKEATCAASGTKTYYFCSKCGAYFEDEECSKEIADISAYKVIPALAHEVVFKSDDLYHWDECKNCGNVIGSKEKHTYAGDACSICGEPKTDHICKGTLVEGFDATCTTAGQKAYYSCSCGKYYEDAEATKEIYDISTWRVIKATGHDFGKNGKKCSVCDEENPYYSELLEEEEPGGDKPGGDTPGGDTPGGDTPSGDTPSGDTPSGDTPSGGTPTGDTPSAGGDQPGGDVPAKEETAPAGAKLVDGEYIAEKQANTKISKAKAAKKSVKLTLKKVKDAKGYEIRYATDSKFKKDVKKYLVKKNKTVSVTIKKLKSKKKYYFKVRTYKEEKFNGKTVKVYSKWSGTKKVTVK